MLKQPLHLERSIHKITLSLNTGSAYRPKEKDAVGGCRAPFACFDCHKQSGGHTCFHSAGQLGLQDVKRRSNFCTYYVGISRGGHCKPTLVISILFFKKSNPTLSGFTLSVPSRGGQLPYWNFLTNLKSAMWGCVRDQADFEVK